MICFLLEPQRTPKDIVVCNPPWGSNCGAKEDGAMIARKLSEELAERGCTFGLFVATAAYERCLAHEKDLEPYGLMNLAHAPILNQAVFVVLAGTKRSDQGQKKKHK